MKISKLYLTTVFVNTFHYFNNQITQHNFSNVMSINRIIVRVKLISEFEFIVETSPRDISTQERS